MKSIFFKYSLILLNFLSLILLAIIEDGFPIANFKYNFACYISLLIGVYLITFKRLFSTLLTMSIIFGLILISYRKIDLIGSRLIVDDVAFALKNLSFVVQFVEAWLLIGLIAFAALLIYIYMVEGKAVKRAYLFKFIIFIPLFFYVVTSPSREIDKYKNIVADDVRDKNLLYFAMSFSSKFQLTFPAPDKDNEKFCCAKANFNDIKITNDKNKPNIIFVLMESTFDISKLSNSIMSGFGGKPYVPVSTYVAGGGTWVQEYAVLHGVSPPVYGDFYKAINTLGPGKLDGRIAPALLDLGYKTQTFSTAKKDFYGADHFHHSLGMKEYISTWDASNKSIEATKKDTVLFNLVFENIQEESEPSFVFVTTELNHAPHHLKLPEKIVNCKDWDEERCAIVNEYVFRERNFVKIFDDFTRKISKLPRDSIVILFGDHIPADINDKFKADDFSDRNKYETIALFYKSKSNGYIKIENILGCVPKFLEISDLDVIALKLAEFESVYAETKLKNKIIKNCF